MVRWGARRRKLGPSTSSPQGEGATSRPMTVTDTGDAYAAHGGTAVTGYRGFTPEADDGSGTTGCPPAQVQASGAAIASQGSVAVSGALTIGTLNVTVPNSQERVSWPVQVGSVPGLATAFQPRNDIRERNAQAEARTCIFSGGGGAGKTQLAAAHARQAMAEGIDLLLWVNAAEVDQVIGSYARAAHRVHAAGAQGQDAEADAHVFLDWLATTPRSWLVVLDDVTSPVEMGPWWPPTLPNGNGRVLATTRRRDATLSGGGRVVVDVGTYSQAEATTYLYDRLDSVGATHLADGGLTALTEALGWLPLALAHAAAYMINEAVTCGEYLQRFIDRQTQLDEVLPRQADTENYGRQVSTTLLLALDTAQACAPIGLAVPTIRLAAYLDPAGHPRGLWSSTTFIEYLSAHRDVGPAPEQPPAEVNGDDARAVLRLLHRYALLDDDAQAGARAVRVHALTARAVREATPSTVVTKTVETVANAVESLWPGNDHSDPDLTAVLRSNTETLFAHSGDLLLTQGIHEALFRSGKSLHAAGLYSSAVAYWDGLAASSERLLGPKHPDTLSVRGNLAVAYGETGHLNESITLLEAVVANRERLHDSDGSDSLVLRANLAASYREVGRAADALELLEQVVAERDRLHGPEHPHTVLARGNLAAAYRETGRAEEAIAIEEQVTADFERLLGPEDPFTLTAYGNLASSYWVVGRIPDALPLLIRVAIVRQQLLGPEHPRTLTALENLANAFAHIGDIQESAELLTRVAEGRERSLGPEHPLTIQTHEYLARYGGWKKRRRRWWHR